MCVSELESKGFLEGDGRACSPGPPGAPRVLVPACLAAWELHSLDPGPGRLLPRIGRLRRGLPVGKGRGDGSLESPG